MNRAGSWIAGIALAALAAAALWKVQAMARADLLAAVDPVAALGIEPTHAGALSRLARRQLRDGDLDAATATARRLLQREPLDPDGWSVIAEATARAQGDSSPEALAMAEIAVRRSKRDLGARARLAQAAMAAGDHSAAMVQLDVMLRLSKPMRTVLIPALIEWAAVPSFRVALAGTLAGEPTWRQPMLGAMAQEIERPEVRILYGALREQGGLSEAETTRWLDALLAKGQWGAAYAHWASGLQGQRVALAPVHNGGFEDPVSDSGFDWRLRKVSGSSASIQSRSDGQGHAARVAFQGRKVDRAGLEQALLLPPGRHVIRMQLRGRNLRSESGLEWVVECPDGRIAGSSAPVEGNFEWRPVEWSVEVPADGCPGQWLRLRNPAPRGASRITSGELWLDEVSVANR